MRCTTHRVMAYGGPDQLTTSLQLFMLLSPPDPLADMQFFMHASSGGECGVLSLAILGASMGDA